VCPRFEQCCALRFFLLLTFLSFSLTFSLHLALTCFLSFLLPSFLIFFIFLPSSSLLFTLSSYLFLILMFPFFHFLYFFLSFMFLSLFLYIFHFSLFLPLLSLLSSLSLFNFSLCSFSRCLFPSSFHSLFISLFLLMHTYKYIPLFLSPPFLSFLRSFLLSAEVISFRDESVLLFLKFNCPNNCTCFLPPPPPPLVYAKEMLALLWLCCMRRPRTRPSCA
jgi:hypothetical protein